MRALLRTLDRLRSPKPIPPATFDVMGRTVLVSFRRNRQARRIVLRLARNGTDLAVTLPPGASRAEALDFVERSRGWIEQKLARDPERIALAPGATIPLRGAPHAIVLKPGARGRIETMDGTITVTGAPEHTPRRLRDWLMAEAKRDLTTASERHAGAMGVAFRKLSVRDQRSRWGSCNAARDLSYSWRLILAPPFVLDYVAAHEVAHLRHLDHSPRFWRLLLIHCPRAAEAKRWLKRDGAGLHRYG